MVTGILEASRSGAVSAAAAAADAGRRPGERARELKAELLKASADESGMKEVLLRMMEQAESEFCAFYSTGEGHCLHVLLDARELSTRLPVIREKLSGAYRMFANVEDGPSVLREKVYYRITKSNLSYLVGNSRIESYFMVPVLSGSAVTGVLYFGSVREDAFVRETISFFDTMAGEDASGSRMHYMLQGETTVLKRLVDRLPYGACLLTADARVEHSNPEFARITGIQGVVPEDLDEIGRSSGFSFSGPFEEYRLTGGPTARRLSNLEDEERVIALEIVRLEGISREIETLVTVRDVSEERARERRIEERLAVTAHELRTPLSGLKNSLRLMKLSEEARGGEATAIPGGRFLDTALRTADRLNSLVDGMVDTSQLRQTERRPELSLIDTEELLKDACRIFEGPMAHRDISLHLSVGVGADSFHGDRSMMSQVIQNLVSNSLKHVPGGGRICIAAAPADEPGSLLPEYCREGLIEGARFIRFRFTDTGPGIPADIAGWINSSPALVEDRGSGFGGLGLYICGRIIDSHGGRMTVHARSGAGGTVEAVLPADGPSSKAVLTMRDAARAFDREVRTGRMPVAGLLIKGEEGCWMRLLTGRGLDPVFGPGAECRPAAGPCVWPVSARSAIVIWRIHASKRGGMTGAELAAARFEDAGIEGISAGFAEYPHDGRKFAELIDKSVEAVSAGVVIRP